MQVSMPIELVHVHRRAQRRLSCLAWQHWRQCHCCLAVRGLACILVARCSSCLKLTLRSNTHAGPAVAFVGNTASDFADKVRLKLQWLTPVHIVVRLHACLSIQAGTASLRHSSAVHTCRSTDTLPPLALSAMCCQARSTSDISAMVFATTGVLPMLHMPSRALPSTSMSSVHSCHSASKICTPKHDSARRTRPGFLWCRSTRSPQMYLCQD